MVDSRSPTTCRLATPAYLWGNHQPNRNASRFRTTRLAALRTRLPPTRATAHRVAVHLKPFVLLSTLHPPRGNCSHAALPRSSALYTLLGRRNQRRITLDYTLRLFNPTQRICKTTLRLSLGLVPCRRLRLVTPPRKPSRFRLLYLLRTAYRPATRYRTIRYPHRHLRSPVLDGRAFPCGL